MGMTVADNDTCAQGKYRRDVNISMNSSATGETLSGIVDEFVRRSKDACSRGRSLFLLVQYEHETVKINFIRQLREKLLEQGITSPTLDPRNRPEQGTGKLYSLLEQYGDSPSVALVTDLPRNSIGSLENYFLEYLNFHRDCIARQTLRFVLFFHTVDAAAFISGAGDLWDFRHHTFWLEERPSSENHLSVIRVNKLRRFRV